MAHKTLVATIMPRIRTSRTRPPPEGFEDIEPILEDYETKMRDAENDPQEGKRKAEGVWGIMRITHIRSRYIYDLYYKREAISRELYDWLLEQGYAQAMKSCAVCDVFRPEYVGARLLTMPGYEL